MIIGLLTESNNLLSEQNTLLEAELAALRGQAAVPVAAPKKARADA